MIQTGKKIPGVIDEELAPAVLTLQGLADLSPEHMGHELHAVADAEHGDAHLEKLRRVQRRSRLVNARRPARKDDSFRLELADCFQAYIEGMNLAINMGFPHPAGDQLGGLRTVVED